MLSFVSELSDTQFSMRNGIPHVVPAGRLWREGGRRFGGLLILKNGLKKINDHPLKLETHIHDDDSHEVTLTN
jgi:hypothetical protein